MKKGLKLTDVLVTVVIAVVCGFLYRLWAPVFDMLKIFGFQVEEFVYGMWFIAAFIAFLILRKPGVALLAETAAASGELLVGSPYGLSTLLYGIFQGLGAELVFAAFGYRSYRMGTMILAAVAATAGSFVMDYFYGYMADRQSWHVMLQMFNRTVGAVVICGVFAFYIVKALEKTGVTDLLRPVSAREKPSFDE